MGDTRINAFTPTGTLTEDELDQSSPLSRTLRMLDDSVCLSDLDQMLNNCPELETEAKGRIADAFLGRIRSIRFSLEDICRDGDEFEFSRIMFSIWLETRLEWARYNDQMQYQAVFKGQAHPELAAQGSALSYIVDIIEKNVTIDKAFWLRKLAASPYESVSSRAIVGQRMIDLTGQAIKGMRALLGMLFESRDKVYNLNREAVKPVDECIARASELVTNILSFKGSDLKEMLEMLMAQSLHRAPVLTLIDGEMDPPDMTISPDVANSIRLLCARWIDLVYEKNKGITSEKRDSQGKSPHISFAWKISRNFDKLSFTISDDGQGNISHQDLSMSPSELGYSITIESTPTEGSKLTADFSLFDNCEFLVFSTDNESGIEFGVPLSHVQSVETSGDIHAMGRDQSFFRSERTGALAELIDLEKLGIPHSQEKKEGVYILLKPTTGRLRALKAEKTWGIRRGSYQPNPIGHHQSPVVGFILSTTGVVDVLNLRRLAQ